MLKSDGNVEEADGGSVATELLPLCLVAEQAEYGEKLSESQCFPRSVLYS